jgi:hypothetical protein
VVDLPPDPLEKGIGIPRRKFFRHHSSVAHEKNWRKSVPLLSNLGVNQNFPGASARHRPQCFGNSVESNGGLDQTIGIEPGIG